MVMSVDDVGAWHLQVKSLCDSNDYPGMRGRP